MGANIGIAILGCGYWGVNYIRVFNELPNTYVAIVCDKRVERLEELAERFPGLRVTTSIDEVLSCEDVDAVVICTEAMAHYGAARQCLLAGRHVLVEKPITTTSADAEELIALSAARRLQLMVGQTFLFNSGVRKVKEYIDRQQLGRIYYLYARRTNLGPIRRDVNVLWDLAPHDISIFNYWLDRSPEWVSAVGTRALGNCREDVGFVCLGFSDGVVGHIHVSWADPNKVREVVIVSSEKRIVFDDLNPLERVRVFEKGVTPLPDEATSFGEHNLLIRDGDILSPRIEVGEPLKTQCLHFLECIATGAQPVSDGWAGLQVVRVMEAITQSIQASGAPIQVVQEAYYERGA